MTRASNDINDLSISAHQTEKSKECWTTEALVDRLFYYLIHVGNGKYLKRTSEFIATSDWSRENNKKQKNTFIFNLSDILFLRESNGKCILTHNDIGNHIVFEIVDLSDNTHSTLYYVLHQVLKRLFTLCSASWFFQSAEAEGQINVRLTA